MNKKTFMSLRGCSCFPWHRPRQGRCARSNLQLQGGLLRRKKTRLATTSGFVYKSSSPGAVSLGAPPTLGVG